MKKILIAMLGLVLCGSSVASEPEFQFAPQCYVHFSPKGGATAAIVDRINKAEKEINLLAYNFASAEIADAIIAASRRIGADGKPVKINLLIDAKQTTANGNKLGYVKSNGVPVYLDKKHAISHNKVIIIDGVWVHTGSFNFSANAENRNAENSVWCKGAEMAKIYNANFVSHQEHAVAF